MLRADKIRVVFHDAHNQPRDRSIKLSFKDGGRDEFLRLLQTVLRRQDWVSAPGQMTMGELSDMQYAQRLAAGDGDAYSASSSGIAGIMRRQEAEVLTAAGKGGLVTEATGKGGEML